MAKKDEQKAKTTTGNDHGRIRGFVFGFDVEGGNEVLAEGIKALTHAMSKGGVVLTPAPLMKPALPTKGNTTATTPGPAVVEAGEPEVEQEVAEEQEVEGAGEGTADGNGTAKPKRPRKIKAPKLLSDVKLNKATVPLADVMKQKNPEDMMDKYAVVARWLKEQFQIEEVTIDHIYTAFKYLGNESQLPTDVAKPLNNLTYNRKWFDKGEAPGTYAINWVGEDAVTKMGTGAGSQ